jgi:hypothetical protein
MYNPDGRKEWYLEECRTRIYESSTAELIEKIFNSTEIEEKAFGKDVCDFTDAEVVDLFKSFNNKSRVRLKNNAWYLSRYHKWCYDKGLTQKIDDAFDDRTIGKMIKEIIPDYILLESYFTKSDLIDTVELDPDYINRIIILGLYYGIKGDDLVDLLNLKIENLNEAEKTLSLKSKRIASVDDYFINTMKKANETEEYVQNANGGNIKKPSQMTYIKNSYVIRKCVFKNDETDLDNPVSVKFITSRLQKFKNEFNTDFISISNLYKNGLINYIKEKYEKQGIGLQTALMYNDGNYVYDKETDGYIKEFGSKTNVRMLRRELKDVIDRI